MKKIFLLTIMLVICISTAGNAGAYQNDTQLIDATSWGISHGGSGGGYGGGDYGNYGNYPCYLRSHNCWNNGWHYKPITPTWPTLPDYDAIYRKKWEEYERMKDLQESDIRKNWEYYHRQNQYEQEQERQREQERIERINREARLDTERRAKQTELFNKQVRLNEQTLRKQWESMNPQVDSSRSISGYTYDSSRGLYNNPYTYSDSSSVYYDDATRKCYNRAEGRYYYCHR